MAEEILSAETPEVAEPETETVEEGVEEQEIAEPVSGGKTEADAAFAEMRRRAEEAERRANELEESLAETELKARARKAVIGELGGTEDADLVALAENSDIPLEDLYAQLEYEEETARRDMENEQIRAERDEYMGQVMAMKALEEIKQIDPNVKSLEELGTQFIDYISARKADGSPAMSYADAYYACKARDVMTKVTPPEPIGKLEGEPAPKDHITREEYECMSEEEIRNNYELIMKSAQKW